MANVVIFDEEEFKEFVKRCPKLDYYNGDSCFVYDKASDETQFIYPIHIINKETYLKKIEKKKWRS